MPKVQERQDPEHTELLLLKGGLKENTLKECELCFSKVNDCKQNMSKAWTNYLDAFKSNIKISLMDLSNGNIGIT